jgi:hypothetical protein
MNTAVRNDAHATKGYITFLLSSSITELPNSAQKHHSLNIND